MNKELVKKLSNAFGPSGHEEDVIDVINEFAQEISVEKDTLKNVYLNYNEATTLPTVMLDAHSDEVGFMVQDITDNGLLRIIPLGGWVVSNIPAHRVIIKTRDGKYVKGTTTSRPPHFMSSAQRGSKLELDDIFVDIGAFSKQEVEDKFHITLGDPIAPEVYLEEITETGLFMGKAFDNRIGCYCVLETLKALKDTELQVQVTGAIASQEEVGCRGAKVTVNKVKPQLAIVFEGSPADDVYDDIAHPQGVLKKGPQIRYIDSGMISNPKLIELARATANAFELPYQCAVRKAGSTNGAAIHISEQGVPCLVLGIPTRYAHTHYGYISMEDIDHSVLLAVAIIKQLNEQLIETL